MSNLSPLAYPDLSKLKKYVLDGVKETEQTNYPPKDFAHYIFELVMEAYFGENIWKEWNKFFE